MPPSVFTARPADRLVEAAQVRRREHISGTPVVGEAGHVLGVLNEKDIRADLDGPALRPAIEPALRRLKSATVQEAVTERAVTLDADASVGEAVRMLRPRLIKGLPVTEKGALVGIVTRGNRVGLLMSR
jgi:CBS domain-containing protein